MARVMLGSGYEPGMGLGKDNGGITSLINAEGNRGKYGLGYKPTQADIKRSIMGRKSGSQNSRLRQEGEGSPPCHISRSFISAGLGTKVKWSRYMKMVFRVHWIWYDHALLISSWEIGEWKNSPAFTRRA